MTRAEHPCVTSKEPPFDITEDDIDDREIFDPADRWAFMEDE